MSDDTATEPSPADPAEVLEEGFKGVPEDQPVRAHVRRLGGSRPMTIGGSVELRRDSPVVDQIVAHVQKHAKESGLYEVKLKKNGDHVVGARLPLEIEEAPRTTPAPPGDEIETPERYANPSPAPSRGPEDALDLLIGQVAKVKKLKELLADDDDDDDGTVTCPCGSGEPFTSCHGEEDDAGEGGEEGEPGDQEPIAESVIEGLGSFAGSETGKALGARLANAFVDRIEAGIEVAKATAQLIVAQAEGKIPMGAPAKAPTPPATSSSTTKPASSATASSTTTQAPTLKVVGIEERKGPDGGKAA